MNEPGVQKKETEITQTQNKFCNNLCSKTIREEEFSGFDVPEHRLTTYTDLIDFSKTVLAYLSLIFRVPLGLAGLEREIEDAACFCIGMNVPR